MTLTALELLRGSVEGAAVVAGELSLRALTPGYMDSFYQRTAIPPQIRYPMLFLFC